MLRKTGVRWEFVSEAALEEFVWNNLETFFGLTPLARQLRVNDEICDIVGVDESKSLGIVELKNVEDRYVIQQLTRYYATLRIERPYSNRIDYSRSPRLLAVAPKFHRHNLIDQEFSTLPIELFVVRVERENGRFFLRLEKNDQPYRTVEVPYRETESVPLDEGGPPPSQLLKWLGCCQPEFYDGLLRLRAKLLSHPRLKETSQPGVVYYGAGKSKCAAEIRHSRTSQQPILFLWLPTPSSLIFQKEISGVGRLRFWLEDGRSISHVGHVPNGFGRMKLESEWKSVGKNQCAGR
jgi:RecB family endonuclease NucS